MDTTTELIEETNAILSSAQQVQDMSLSLGEAERKELLENISDQYRDWYHRCLKIFSHYGEQELRQEFINEYEGDWKSHKINSFLSLGWKAHRVADWVAPYERSFKKPLHKQCDLLATVKTGANLIEVNADVLLVETICERIPYTAKILKTRSRKDKSPYLITDEYDVQDLLQGVLRAYLKYTVQEDPLQKVAGTRSSRADISIEELGIIIEVKYAYGPNDQKRIFDDLSKDLLLYTSWPYLKTLICLIYNSGSLREPLCAYNSETTRPNNLVCRAKEKTDVSRPG